MKNYKKFIEDNTIECEVGYRGGGITVNVAKLFPKIGDPLMGAYQNYLGGGLLGKVVSVAKFDLSELNRKQRKTFFELEDETKRHLHELTNHWGDEWDEMTYLKNQCMPVSAY